MAIQSMLVRLVKLNKFLGVWNLLLEEHESTHLADKVFAYTNHAYFRTFVYFRVINWFVGDDLLVVDDGCELWPRHEGLIMI